MIIAHKLKPSKLLICFNCSKIIGLKKLSDLTKKCMVHEPMKNGLKCANFTTRAKKEKGLVEMNLPDSVDQDLVTGLSLGSNTLFSKSNSKRKLLKKLLSLKIFHQNIKKFSLHKKSHKRNF